MAGTGASPFARLILSFVGDIVKPRRPKKFPFGLSGKSTAAMEVAWPLSSGLLLLDPCEEGGVGERGLTTAPGTPRSTGLPTTPTSMFGALGGHRLLGST